VAAEYQKKSNAVGVRYAYIMPPKLLSAQRPAVDVDKVTEESTINYRCVLQIFASHLTKKIFRPLAPITPTPKPDSSTKSDKHSPDYIDVLYPDAGIGPAMPTQTTAAPFKNLMKNTAVPLNYRPGSRQTAAVSPATTLTKSTDKLDEIEMSKNPLFPSISTSTSPIPTSSTFTVPTVLQDPNVSENSEFSAHISPTIIVVSSSTTAKISSTTTTGGSDTTWIVIVVVMFVILLALLVVFVVRQRRWRVYRKVCSDSRDFWTLMATWWPEMKVEL
jgi:hypothetical protein